GSRRPSSSEAPTALGLVVGAVATYLIVRSQLRAGIDNSLRRQSAAVRIGHGEKVTGFLQTQTKRGGGTGGTTPPVGALSIVRPNPGFGNAPLFFQLINRRGRVDPGEGRPELPASQRAT